ncbi:MAG: hypothetical protein PW843_25755 [Azospirillaceae bacterium]|nr:hypothetical protein [Azospirillaceae bacterium]
MDKTDIAQSFRMRPIHPGEILREQFLEPLGLTAGKVAKACNLPRSRIAQHKVKEPKMSQNPNVPHDDFRAGFEVGWQTVVGTGASVPLAPLTPLTPLGSTPFLEGVKAGLEAAGIDLDRR